MQTLWLAVLLVFFAQWIHGLHMIVYEADEVKVQAGLHECISNCSTKSLSCQIEECSTPQTSSSYAQGLDVEDVYLQKFTDPNDNQIRLALFVKWKPKENAGVSRTKGYLVDISNGETTYRRCYEFPAPLTLASAKNEFYNDCFGKIEGTSVKLGSSITINITSLPLAEDDTDYGKTMLVVNTPDCSDSDLQTMEECSLSEDVPTNQECQTNCNTFSTVKSTTYPIVCTISKNVLGSGPEKCDKTNRTVLGTPSHPKYVQKEQEWYKFVDGDEVKVALNFSWAPKVDSSIKDLLGYYIEVFPEGKSDQTNFNKCFTIHTDMTEAKHKNAVFFYDCYGRESPTSVTPGESYRVSIRSRNGSNNDLLSFAVLVPGCADSEMQDVTQCIKENNRYIEGQVAEVICENRTLVYSYRISPEYGYRAEVLFCEKGYLSCSTLLQDYKDLDLSGTLYNLSLPSSANLSINYSIILSGNVYSSTRHTTVKTLTECIPPEAISVVAVAMISLASVLFLLIVAFFIWFIFYRHKYACGILRKFQDVYWSPSESYPDDFRPSVKVPGLVKVYVAFSEDNALHKDVIHWFCTFLKHELGVDVYSSIWDGNVASVNRARYVIESVRDVDKVVMICSQGGKDCLGMPNNEEPNTSLFSPVVNQAYQNLVAGNNPEKYLVAYFGYSSPQDIPKPLLEQLQHYSKPFNLMKQFEQFYFRLVDVEQYQDTGILKIKEIERYADETARSDCGKKLHSAIEMMKIFTQANPDWHPSRLGAGDARTPTLSIPASANNTPQAVHGGFDNPAHSLPNADHEVEQPSISIMHPSAPPPVAQAHCETGPNLMVSPQNHQYVNINQDQVQNAHNPVENHHVYKQVGPAYQEPLHQSHESEQSILYPLASTAEWTAPKRQPLEHSEETRKPQEQGSMLASTESSFEIPDTYISSLSPSEAASKPKKEQEEMANATSVPHHMLRNLSYHADSFSPSDFPMSDFDNGADSHMMTNLPSNETEMTSVGLQPSELQEQNRLIDQLLSPDRVPSTEESPESGLFTLANLDSDEGDIEDQIKSINISSDFGLVGDNLVI